MKSAPSQMFDLSYLNQIFQGNSAMINSIIEMFLKQVPDYIAEMEACVFLKDYKSLHPLAHKAKSSVAMLGLKKMESLILKIESTSKIGLEVDELPGLVSDVRHECDLAYDELTAVIKK